MVALRSLVRGRRVDAGMQLQQLAAAVGISRQSLSAIEAGTTVPSTTLALTLAKALRCRVDDLFGLRDSGTLVVTSPGDVSLTGRVRLGRVGDRWIAYPLEGSSGSIATTPADGLWARRGRVTPLRSVAELEANLFVAGCDPALGQLAGHLAEAPGHVRLHWLEASSRAALDALAQGWVHVAGVHLFDEAAGIYNVPAIRACLGRRPLVVVTLALWPQGIVIRRNAVRRIHGVEDLARRSSKVVLRESGSGARILFDRELAARGIRPDDLDVTATVRGHLDVARMVAAGLADVGVASAAAAAAFDLGFVALAEERFDLVMTQETAAAPSGVRLLEMLTTERFRRDIGALRGYRTGQTGTSVVVS